MTEKKVKNDPNIKANKDKYLELVNQIGITAINDEKIFLQSITFSCYYNENNDKQILFGHNRVIALIGDNILKAVLSIQFYKDNYLIESGELTKSKENLENNDNLEKIGNELELKNLFLHSNNDLDNSGMARGIEALIGCIHLCHGFEYAEKFVNLHII